MAYMPIEVAMVELRAERQTLNDRLAAFGAERDGTLTPSKREMLDSKIRTLTQHLFDMDAVLNALLASGCCSGCQVEIETEVETK
jgi:hypothetical protein